MYEQAIGFLRVPESSEVLDNTDIHPQQYPLAKYISSTGISASDISSYYQNNISKLVDLYPDVTEGTLEFIVNSLEQAGIEKRVNSTHKKATVR